MDSSAPPDRTGKIAATTVIIGLIGLLTLFFRPRFSTYSTVDVVQLLASGACFGIAFAALLGGLRRRNR